MRDDHRGFESENNSNFILSLTTQDKFTESREQRWVHNPHGLYLSHISLDSYDVSNLFKYLKDFFAECLNNNNFQNMKMH